MIVTLHMCMPAGDAMRQRFGDLMETMKRDNRGVVAAMLADGAPVPDTVGDLGLQYVGEQHRRDSRGQPIMEIYGLRDMVERGTFSCGDAVALESAIMEEKYGIQTLCLAVAQGDDDLHAIYVTSNSVVDPMANFMSGHRTPVPQISERIQGSACILDDDGRVVCVEEDVCSVSEDGTWLCPSVPGLSGRQISIGKIERSPGGQAWAKTPNGAVVPVRRSR